jgi:hypothetical protein
VISDAIHSDVTSEESLITFNVYDRVSDQFFLGTFQIKPVLIHDHTVDQWFKYVAHSLLPTLPTLHPASLSLTQIANAGSGRLKPKL